MCGICGIYTLNHHQRIDEALVVTMRDTMRHRGPDDMGLYIAPGKDLGFGHRRLSIIDLSANGRQPMPNEDETVWITYNGEVYNFLELKDALEQKGHRFRSRTDTEVLLHLYEEYGEEMVHRLRGMFAFGIWDEQRKKLFVARDRLGIKPIYYAYANGAFVFGSEIKSILASGILQPEFNREGLYQYLTFGYTLPPVTMFKGICKLEPGHYLSLDSKGKLEKKQYWDIYSEVSETELRSEEEYIEEVLETLRTSVKIRLISDVPVGVFLSGGVDSSLVTALVAESKDVPLKTFTLGFKDNENYNELVYARQVAKLLNAESHEILIDATDVINFFPRFFDYQEEPLGNPIWIPIYFVSQLARDNGVKVVLSGDGGDELFAGYNRWMSYLKFYNRVWKYYSKTPRTLRSLNYAVLKPFVRDEIKCEALKRSAHGEELFWGGTAFKERELEVFLNERTYTSLQQSHPYSEISALRNTFEAKHHSADYLEWMSYIALKTSLLEDYLMRLDKMGMAASIEGRVPLLDHKFAALALSIPPTLKYKNYENKYLLKKVAATLVPRELIYRKKMGFCAPLEEWLIGKVRDLFKESLLFLQEKEGIFSGDGLSKLIGSLQHQSHSLYGFWGLLTLSLWYKRWMRG
jgi:asparagine synthase (glutamine-hydrolysing)